jgi:signal transduction histidine kinase
MRLGNNKIKVVWFVMAFFLLLLSYILMYVNTNKLSQQALWMDHTNRVITNLELLASEYKTLELNYRSFMGSRQDDAKTNYYLSVKKTDSLYDLVRNLATDPNQLLELDTINNQIIDKTSTYKKRIDSAGPIAPNILLKDFRKEVGTTTTSSASIVQNIRQMEVYENALLSKRYDKLQGFNNSILIIIFISLIIALVLALYSIYTYVKENAARQIADEKSEQYKIELEKRVNELAQANKEILELRNSEKFASIGRIAHTIAHEVRNPLTNINLAAEQIKDTIQQNEESNLLLSMIKRNGLRINQLISNLLHATKFSELNFKKVSINKIIDRTLELAQDRISLKHLTIKKEYANNIPDILVDEEKLKIAFLNIIVNALESLEKGNGILKITTEKIENKCKIIFADNGIGMNDEEMSKLFEPFFTNKEKGTGLGLTNTQNIILNHKGKIEVESTEGQGSTFTIILNIV